jgi:hypothetical protein
MKFERTRPEGPPTSNKGAGESWLDSLGNFARAVAPSLIAAGSLIGFVAFAGSVIVWTRFSVAQVPPDQVVAAFPRGELVAIASARLLIFGFVGLVAVAIFFLISRERGSPETKTATTEIFRVLLVLFAVEAGAAIYLVDSPWIEKGIAWELVVLATAIAFWFTFIFERPDLWNAANGPQKEEPEASQKIKAGDDDESGLVEQIQDVGSDALKVLRLEHKRFRSVIAWSFLLALVIGGGLILTGVPFDPVVIGGVAFIITLPSFWLLRIWVKNLGGPSKPPEPGSIPYTRAGQVLIAVLLLVAALLPAWVLGTTWLIASLFIAGLLVMGVWRVAVLFGGRFAWYGLAVFISVVFFGAFTWSARDIADPQVQPVALIRQQDGPDEAIQGIYVTETDDRIYFAKVATEGCSNDLVPHSGRLLWVPKEDVVAMSIGPLQSVDDATKTALEMSYALTPAVETPAGDHVSLTVAEKRGNLAAEKKVPQKRRLEDLGPAVQPNFGAGLHLVPENASPGDVVTLKMAKLDEHAGSIGFGASRQGRTVRLGGAPVEFVKEEAGNAFEAEYVETDNGRALKLRKDTLYTRQAGEWKEARREAELEGEPAFVRLADDSAVELNEREEEGDGYIPLKSLDEGPPALEMSEAGPPEVTLEDGSSPALKSRLLRQAWHEDEISFRVPDHGVTGAVTVECDQLSGQPLLRVARPPRPSIAVRIKGASRHVVFDSKLSKGRASIVSRHWWVEGIDRGEHKRIAINLPPRLESYSVRLDVTDSEGQTGTTQVHLLRLPAHLVAFDGHRARHPKVLKKARAELRQATAVEPAAAIELDMRPADRSRSPNPERAINQAKRIRRYLLRSRPAQSSSQPADPDGLVVRAVAFGGSCPAERASKVGRLDVLVLGRGGQAIPPERCPAVRLSTVRQLLPPP